MDTMLRHLDLLYVFYGERLGVCIARKHLAWYSKGRPGAAEFRRTVNLLNSPEEQLELTRDFFQGLEELETIAA
ncbi:MAG: hypothetical protein GY731_00670 [Gammaproteobacteria bacterium]|nr:hypothetical protein [Gammaproteobacteria bacterium]